MRCEERVSQEDFPRQGEQGCGLHSKSLRPCPGRRVENAWRLSLKLRLKPRPSLTVRLLRKGPQRPAFLQVPRGEVRSRLCPTRMPVRLVSLPR